MNRAPLIGSMMVVRNVKLIGENKCGNTLLENVMFTADEREFGTRCKSENAWDDKCTCVISTKETL